MLLWRLKLPTGGRHGKLTSETVNSSHLKDIKCD